MSERSAIRVLCGMLALVFLLAMGAVRSSWTEDQTVGVHTEQQAAEGVHKKEAESSLSPQLGKQAPASDGQAAEKKGEAGEDASEFWPPIFGYRFKVTDSLLVLFTAILAWKTAGLDKATRKLWEAGERQIEHVRISANAAKASADAAVAVSGAHVRVVNLLANIGSGQKGYIIETEFGNSLRVHCEWQIKNFGASPADLYGWSFRTGAGSENSSNFNGISRDVTQTIASGGFGEEYSESLQIRLDDQEWNRLLERQSFVWINISLYIWMYSR